MYECGVELSLADRKIGKALVVSQNRKQIHLYSNEMSTKFELVKDDVIQTLELALAFENKNKK